MRTLTRTLLSLWLVAGLGRAGGPFFFGSNFVAAGGAGITLTGKTCISGFTSAATVTCTWSATPTVGNNLHCFVNDYSGAALTFAVTDNASVGNTYVANGSTFVSTISGHYKILDSFAIAHAPTTSTLTSTGGNMSFGALSCFESSGDTVVDTTAAGVDQASFMATSVSATVAPTGSADAAACITSSPGGTTITPGGGFTNLSPGNPAANLQAQNKLLVASGSQTLTVNYSPANQAELFCTTYK